MSVHEVTSVFSPLSPRRAVLKATQFTCPFARSCAITKAKRRQCQACRYQKCLAVGMKKDSEWCFPTRFVWFVS